MPFLTFSMLKENVLFITLIIGYKNHLHHLDTSFCSNFRIIFEMYVINFKF